MKSGRLTVVSRIPGAGKTYYKCVCECGSTLKVRGDHLQDGHVASCGCLHKERSHELNVRHGMAKSRLYSIWLNMRQRCLNVKHTSYKYYGGAGVCICNEWKLFEPFKDWAVANGYAPTLTIDRIESSGPYAPGNCRWITQSENTIRAHLGKKRRTKSPLESNA